ncbi:hypothetical protein ABPG73_000976 [Tetrahymena malaccensis]
MPSYSFCKRLDRNRECDEALTTIQIDQNQLYVSEDSTLFDPRCAKIDTINQICLSPRFPYTLDIQTNSILHVPNSFCRLQLNSNCIQNYETFYIDSQTTFYYKLQNFINANLIEPQAIYDQEIKCLQPYVYQSSLKGCIPSKFNCNQNDGKTCICEQNQAVDSTGSTCSDQFQNCFMYGQVGQIQYCMTCNSGFYLYQNKCVPISSKNSPTCDTGSQLDLNSLKYLQTFLININPSINQDMSDPLYLIILKYSIDVLKDPKYLQFKGSNPNFTFNCEQAFISGIACTQSIQNLCIQCQNSDIYYIQQQGSQSSLNLKYEAFCGKSEDKNINNCKIISNNQCVLCKEQYMMNQQKQCVQGTDINCLTYDDQGNCLFCIQDFILINSKCNQMCDQGNVFTNTNSSTNCVPFNIEYQYCLISSQSQGCIQCPQGYFLDKDNQCNVNTNTNYCIVFDTSKNECKFCQKNFKYFNKICQGSLQQIQGLTFGNEGLSIDYYTMNQKGSYLDYDFNYQTCQTNNNLACNKCYQQYCLDKISNCPAGYGWSELYQKCFIQCQNGMLLNFLKCDNKKVCDNLFSCSNCSLVSNINDCGQKCSQGQYFSKLLNSCFFYCGNYQIAKDQSSCQSTTLCIDGLQWNNTDKKCYCQQWVIDSTGVSQCSNCSLVTDLSLCNNKCAIYQYYSATICMEYCGNAQISKQYQTCSKSNLCIDGFQWDTQNNQCSKQCSQSNCQIQCDQKTIDPYFNIQQCPNCSLVTNPQLCKNPCNNSQIYFQNSCMAYCGKGLVANGECQNSSTCVEGYVYQGNGYCDKQQSKSYESDQSNLNIDWSFSMTNVIVIAIIFLIITLFAIWVIKKLKNIPLIIKQNSQEMKKQQEEEYQILINQIEKQQFEIQTLNQLINTYQQVSTINQNEFDINPNNNQNQNFEEQSPSQHTIQIMMKNDNQQLEAQYSQQQLQSTPNLQNE